MKITVFVDDGHPESWDSNDNYHEVESVDQGIGLLNHGSLTFPRQPQAFGAVRQVRHSRGRLWPLSLLRSAWPRATKR